MVQLLDNLRLHDAGIFTSFCDILTLAGHPMIANYLRDSVLASRTFNFDDLWEQIPNLNKQLRQWEKDKLSSYLSGKMKEELVRLTLGDQKEERERATDARIKQVEQSWKFQKEVKERDTAVAQLKDKVKDLENSLLEKGETQKEQKRSMQKDIEKLSGTVQIATKFNMANDNAIRRLQETLNHYRGFTSHFEDRLAQVDSATGRRKNRPSLQREETSLEGLRLEFDTERHLEHLRLVLDRILSELDALRRMKRQHEILISAAQFVSHQLAPPDATSNLPGVREQEDEASQLRRAYAVFSMHHEEIVGCLRGELNTVNRYVRGRLPSPEVPETLRDLPMVSREEKIALEKRVRELEQELQTLRERPAGSARGVDSPAAPASIFPGPRKPRATVPPAVPAPTETRPAPMPVGIPFSYHSKRTHREPKTTAQDRRNPNAKPLSTRVVNFL